MSKCALSQGIKGIHIFCAHLHTHHLDDADAEVDNNDHLKARETCTTEKTENAAPLGRHDNTTSPSAWVSLYFFFFFAGPEDEYIILQSTILHGLEMERWGVPWEGLIKDRIAAVASCRRAIAGSLTSWRAPWHLSEARAQDRRPARPAPGPYLSFTVSSDFLESCCFRHGVWRVNVSAAWLGLSSLQPAPISARRISPGPFHAHGAHPDKATGRPTRPVPARSRYPFSAVPLFPKGPPASAAPSAHRGEKITPVDGRPLQEVELTLCWSRRAAREK